jgi:hypothetical protein
MASQNRNQDKQGRNPQEPNYRRVVPASAGGGFAWWWVWVVIVIAAFWFAGWGWGGYGGWWWGGRRPGIVGKSNSRINGTPDTAANSNRSTTGANNPATYGAPANGTVSTNPALTHTTGSGLDVLNSTDKATYVGKNFQVENIPIQQKVSSKVLWVGQSNGNRILVVSNQPIAATTTTNGNRNAAPNIQTPGNGGQGANGNGGAMGSANANANSAAYTHAAQTDLVDVQGTVQKAPSARQAEKQWGLSTAAAKLLEREGAYVQASQVQPVIGGWPDEDALVAATSASKLTVLPADANERRGP